MPEQLQIRQQRFIEEYLKDNTGGAAGCAVRAGYSEATAAQQANRLLRNVHVKAAIAEGMIDKQTRYQIDADTLVQRLVRIIDSDPGDYIRIEDGGLKVVPGPGMSDAIDSLTTQTVKTSNGLQRIKVTYKATDRLKAMEMLIELLGLWPSANASQRDSRARDQKLRLALERHSARGLSTAG